jgi:hypothetical protein
LRDGVAYIELAPPGLARALDPFPLPVRTPDALHLATMEFGRGHGQAIELASSDARPLAAASIARVPTRQM